MKTQREIIKAAIADYMNRVKPASLSGLDCRPYVYFKPGMMALVMPHETPPAGYSVWDGTLVTYADYDSLFPKLMQLTARCPMLG